MGQNSPHHEADHCSATGPVLSEVVSQKSLLAKACFASESTTASPRGSFAHKTSAGKNLQQTKVFRDGPVVIELFAGSGRFTAALKANGVHSAFGVDHKKLSSIAPIMLADLTTKAGQALFMTWMDTPNLAGIFAAPPCGTCSLARNIKIRGPKGNFISGPVPLRSQKFPEGFPNLSGTNLKRVLDSSCKQTLCFLVHGRGKGKSAEFDCSYRKSPFIFILVYQIFPESKAFVHFRRSPGVCLRERKTKMDCVSSQQAGFSRFKFDLSRRKCGAPSQALGPSFSGKICHS